MVEGINMSNDIYKIYKITNNINDKVYIGQTKQNLERRFAQHCVSKHLIGKALRKHGSENFTIETLLVSDSLDYVNLMEVEVIKAYETLAPKGYNLASGGKYFKHCEETKRKISEKAKERGVSVEMMEKARIVNTGTPRSQEIRDKISKAQKGKKITGTHLANLRASMKNRKSRCDIKQVHCITLGTIFDSAKEAAEMLGIKTYTIQRICSGARNKTQCGLKFEYI